MASTRARTGISIAPRSGSFRARYPTHSNRGYRSASRMGPTPDQPDRIYHHPRREAQPPSYPLVKEHPASRIVIDITDPAQFKHVGRCGFCWVRSEILVHSHQVYSCSCALCGVTHQPRPDNGNRRLQRKSGVESYLHTLDPARHPRDLALDCIDSR